MVLSLGREIGMAVAAAGALWIATLVVRSARRLNSGVRAFKAEQEKQDGVVDPYAALSALYAPTQKSRQTRLIGRRGAVRRERPRRRFGRHD